MGWYDHILYFVNGVYTFSLHIRKNYCDFIHLVHLKEVTHIIEKHCVHIRPNS